MTKALLLILFFTLPLVHGRIFPTLGLDIYFSVSGNFEFTKAIYFNIFSGIIFLSFFLERFILQSLKAPLSILSYKERGSLILIFLVLVFSTFFSVSPFMSLIGDLEKGHTTLLFFNLLGLFLVLSNYDKVFLKKLLYTSLLTGIFSSLLALKELYFPSYDYGTLGNRALGSFGHPNYLAGYLLLLFPLTQYIHSTVKKHLIITICILGILFSQSVVALVLTAAYISYLLVNTINIKRSILLGVFGASISLLLIIITLYFPEKLHSFISRFYLWNTTLKIIFSDIKIFFIGGGTETLPYYFDSFKVPEVYIFENYGFTADRPHNFALNIFYSFGVFALGLFLYSVYYFGKHIKNTPENIALLLFLLFGIIHYFSIASYVLVILIITLSIKKSSSFFKGSSGKQGRIKAKEYITYTVLALISLTGGYYSIKLYQSEILYNQKKYVEASENMIHPKYLIKISDYSSAENLENITSQSSYKNQITLLPEKQNLCDQLTENYPSAENYIYCGNLFWDLEKYDISKEYYITGLSKLPDLWNQDSQYWDKYFVKHTITGNRFFSEKFGNLESVLEKVGK